MRNFFPISILLIFSWSQLPQQNVGTQLVWHYVGGTFDGGEVTTYIMGDRRRTEFHNTSMRRQPDGSFAREDPPANVVIERCDLGRSFGLNTDSHQYSQHPFPPQIPISEERKASGFDNSDWDAVNLPSYRVEITTVDTGEREQIFGQTARHVITTTKSTPTGDTKGDPHTSVKDGWYIEYDRRVSCEPRPVMQVRSFGGFLRASGTRLIRTTKAETAFVGTPENGLFVRGKPSSFSISISGSNGVNLSFSNDAGVTAFYRGPLDPALFEVPAGYMLGDRILY
jgi:hypothetical protein